MSHCSIHLQPFTILQHMRSYATTLLVALLALTTSAQNNYAIVLDTAGTSNYPRQYGILCSDGSSVLSYFGENSTLLRRMDATGNLIWNKWYPGARILRSEETCTPLAPDDNGGFFVAHAPMGSVSDENWNDFDTLVWRLVITHVASDGTVLWRTDLERTEIEVFLFLDLWQPAGVSLVVHDQNLMYALVEHEAFGGWAHWQLIALDPSDGTVLWVRDVSDNGGISTARQVLKAACLSNGDVIVGCGTDGPLGDMFLARISTNGDLLWMNRYDYTNGAAYTRYSDFIVSPTGKIIALGRVDAVMNGFVLYHINDDGTLDHGEFAEEGSSIGGNKLAFAPGAGLIVSLSNGYTETVLLFGDTLGGSMERHELLSPIVGPNTVVTALNGLVASGQEMLLYGAAHQYDQFGTWSRRPVIARYDAPNFTHCLDSVSVSPRLQLPVGVVVTEPSVNGFSAPPIFPYITIASTPVALVDVPSVATIDLCDMIISTGEPLQHDALLRIWPIPASAGTALRVTGAERCKIELIDPQGRVVRVQAPSATAEVSIGTEALSPGWYAMRCTAADGVVRVAQVVLE